MTITPRRSSPPLRSAEQRRGDPGKTTTVSPGNTRLEASALTLGYADTDVVRELDLRVPHGKVTVIVGANACGKSTLLRGLARLLRPRSGSVLLDG